MVSGQDSRARLFEVVGQAWSLGREFGGVALDGAVFQDCYRAFAVKIILHARIPLRLGGEEFGQDGPRASSFFSGGALSAPESWTRMRAPVMLPALVLSMRAWAMRSDCLLTLSLMESRRRGAPRPAGVLDPLAEERLRPRSVVGFWIPFWFRWAGFCR